MKFKKISMVLATAGALLATGQASATNWLKLQGTEDPGVAVRAKVWGFLQPTYQKDNSPGTVPEPTRIGPNLDRQDQFQLYRARIGVRGIALPLDSNVNYFAMFEMGQNGSTDSAKFGEKTQMRMMDASVTLNHIPKARVRVGLFKTPGPEEVFQGIAALDYINFSWVGNQLMLERYPTGSLDPTCALGGATCGDGTRVYGTEFRYTSNFGAARDTGIQIFDWIDNGDWTHSYAIMVGNGSGLEVPTNYVVGNDAYLYWASEKNFTGGRGPWAHGWKTFAWSHSGKRQVDMTDDGMANPTEHDRTRWGVGTRYRKGSWRIGAEYMAGKGMIFQGPEKPDYAINTLSGLDSEANGYVLDIGYYVPKSKWELDLRYDEYHRSNEATFGVNYTNLTVGAQYHLNRKSKVILNYEMRTAKASSPSAPIPFQNNVGQIGDRIGAQLTMIF